MFTIRAEYNRIFYMINQMMKLENIEPLCISKNTLARANSIVKKSLNISIPYYYLTRIISLYYSDIFKNPDTANTRFVINLIEFVMDKNITLPMSTEIHYDFIKKATELFLPNLKMRMSEGMVETEIQTPQGKFTSFAKSPEASVFLLVDKINSDYEAPSIH